MKNNEQQILNPKKLKQAKQLNRLLRLFSPSVEQNIPIRFKDIKRILIMEYECIGDFIMLLPVLESIRQVLPDAKIDIVCTPAVLSLMKGSILMDELIPWTGNSVNKRKCIRSLRKQHYDLSLNFHGDIRQIWKMKHVKAKYKAGFSFSGGEQWLTHVMDYPYWLHQVERPLHLLEFIGIKGQVCEPELSHIKPDHKFDNVIFLHSGANHAFRKWPDSNWQKLACELKKEYKVVWVDVPGSAFCPDGISCISGDLYKIAEVFSAGKFCICCDSMAAHLAAAVNTPVLALFGSQDPELTKPYGQYGYVAAYPGICTHKRRDWRLCEECMSSLSVEEILTDLRVLIKNLEL